MRIAAIASVLLLAGCAYNHYDVTPGSGADPTTMNVALGSCEKEAMSLYEKSQRENYSLANLVVGAFAGGAIGGFATGALSSEQGQMKASDIDPYIQKCMADKGYTGESEN